MNIYTRNLKQTATYWAPTGNDGFGKVTFAAPVEIACRWQNKTDRVQSPDGDEFVSRSVVFVDRELEVEGMLYLGSSAETDPNVAGANKIKQRGGTPNLRADAILHKVWL